jgi:serine/threonine protein kinase
MDPKTFTSFKINEKSDIYSLGIIYWELTSRSSPFNFETRHDNVVMLEILKGEREKPIPGTNVKYIELYQSKYEVNCGSNDHFETGVIFIFFCCILILFI